jgi:hypothetical protein
MSRTKVAPGRRLPGFPVIATAVVALALAGLAALIWSVTAPAVSGPPPVEQVTKPALGS